MLVVILVLAAVTYLSRAAALVLLPDPSPRVRRILDRVPAPLFAGLAGLSLVEAEGSFAAAPVLGAAAGALLAAPFRSLPLALAGGLAGYAVTLWLM